MEQCRFRAVHHMVYIYRNRAHLRCIRWDVGHWLATAKSFHYSVLLMVGPLWLCYYSMLAILGKIRIIFIWLLCFSTVTTQLVFFLIQFDIRFDALHGWLQSLSLDRIDVNSLCFSRLPRSLSFYSLCVRKSFNSVLYSEQFSQEEKKLFFADNFTLAFSFNFSRDWCLSSIDSSICVVLAAQLGFFS